MRQLIKKHILLRLFVVWLTTIAITALTIWWGSPMTYRLGEVYNFKDDYVSFVENKLYKGRYKKGGWYINWDKKKNAYNVLKS